MFIQSQQYKEENYGPKRCQGNNETLPEGITGEADIDAVLAIETGYSISKRDTEYIEDVLKNSRRMQMKLIII